MEMNNIPENKPVQNMDGQQSACLLRYARQSGSSDRHFVLR